MSIKKLIKPPEKLMLPLILLAEASTNVMTLQQSLGDFSSKEVVLISRMNGILRKVKIYKKFLPWVSDFVTNLKNGLVLSSTILVKSTVYAARLIEQYQTYFKIRELHIGGLGSLNYIYDELDKEEYDDVRESISLSMDVADEFLLGCIVKLQEKHKITDKTVNYWANELKTTVPKFAV